MELPEVTPYLENLITYSSLPLKAIESDFAVDSSGFSTCTYVRWFDEKYGKQQSERDWVKAHIITGVKNQHHHVCRDKRCADHNYFAPLVNDTAKYFEVKEVSADAAYSSHRIVE